MTPAQLQTLQVIDRLTRKNGFHPSQAEISDERGSKNPSAARGMFDRLQREGFVTREPHEARSIRITEKGYKHLRDHERAT